MTQRNRYNGDVKSAPNVISPQVTSSADRPQVSDAILVDRAAGGDEAALRALMDRYDRLVRYTIFRIARNRCRKDPAWLDTVSGDAWVGFVQSIRRTGEPPDAPAAYLIRIARNKAISALRSATRHEPDPDDSASPLQDEEDPSQDPSLLLTSLEELEALKGCLELLDADDRELATQLSVLIERRWRDAAAALGLAESTVRSRWKRTLDRLRACLEGKTGRKLAPPPDSSDQ